MIGKNLTNKTKASFRNALQSFGSVGALAERDRSIAARLSFGY